jgi:flagellar protein FliS
MNQFLPIERERCLGVGNVDLKRVANLYKKSNQSTLPTVEYVLLLLKEAVKNINFYRVTRETSNPVEESISYLIVAQQLLFELLATVDRDIDAGERLYTFYAYLNQCLVDVRLTDNAAPLELVEEQLLELIDSWEESKQTTRLRTYTTPYL